MSGSWTFDWGESHSMISAECWVAAHAFDRDVMGCFARSVLQTVEHRHVAFHFLESEVDELADFGELYLDKEFVVRFFQRSAEVRAEYFRFHQHFKSLDLRAASNASLAALFAEYWFRYRRITAFFNATIGFYLEAVEKRLKSLLLTELGDELRMQELFSTLTLPTDLDIIKLEELDLAELRCGEAGSDKKALLAHAEKHPWYFFNTYCADDAVQFLELRIAEGANSVAQLRSRFEEEIGTAQKAHRRILSKLKHGKDAGELADRLREFGHDRLELKAVWSGSEFLFRELFTVVSDRLSVPLDELMWVYRASEIQSALAGVAELPKAERDARKEFYLFRLDGGRLEFLSGEAAKDVARKELGYGTALSKTEASGTIAHPGIAEGSARLVFLRDLKQLMADLDAFEPGDIMVTQMTQPTMVAMAKKAAAIVTDEGGITSHAAIIARELNIPCLVGCKIATKIFKTGDRIRVDARQGNVAAMDDSSD